MEYFDILNENGELSGERASDKEVHEKGLLHRVVHVWFLNSKGEVLLQKRAKDRYAYPGHWDMSVGGHVTAGDTSIDTAIKETREELGITLPASAFELIFRSRDNFVTNNGTYVVNEFQDVYLVRSDMRVEEFSISHEEVEEVRFVPLRTFEEWVAERREGIVPHIEEYRRLFAYLSEVK